MVEVATSILNIDREKAIRTLYDLEYAKTDYFHIDVMDGKFVKKDTSSMMREYCEYLNSISNLPLDVHLMVEDVESYIDSYLIYEPNILTFHYEACKKKEQVLEYIKYIKERNCRVGITLNPDTPIEEIYEFLPYVHMALIMTVVPGEGGQKMIDSTIDKIKRVKEYCVKNEIDIDIEADGGITLENAPKVREAGANILVAGKTIVSSKDYAKTILELKNA